MRRLLLSAFTALCLAALQPITAAAQTTPPAPPTVEDVAPGVWLIQGLVLRNRQPDGNTVIFQAPRGLIVMDTGRHPWHRQAILDFAEAGQQPIVAVVNSHWHLDHVSGNIALKRAYPSTRVYASRAIDGAIAGFLATSAAEGRRYLDDKSLPPETLEDLKADLATTDAAAQLRPDVVIAASGPRTLGGRRLQLNLAPDAATAGDVWVYDAKARIAAVGDLVTLPAPYLDTACPGGWRAALARVWAAPFETAVPGHGRPMTRAQFALYRHAFEAMIDCSNSNRPKAECGAAWAHDAAPLLQSNGFTASRAAATAEYYVGEVLRPHGGRSASCMAA
jgi:glyoxylase-like metal-dependent hydrolase (beta-lactamase superfamily II)